ncbi:sugar phosphate isomerase/epimerase family protein [Cohnella sp.]|uniref:sugar phosphate isomerase/epimerase family protein n=1 Tax=Cohnella sp. TaxID=1883426 RepID=UPI003567276B
MGMKFGCHGYTWQLSYETQSDNLTHIMDVISDSGFKGLDTQVVMLGRFHNHPTLLKEELHKRNLELAALTLSLHWLNEEETDAERSAADYFVEYLRHFPNALLNVVQMPGNNREQLQLRQRNVLNCVNSLARRAADKGVVTAFHPNSPPGSVFRNIEDYKIMFEGLDTNVIGYTPDAGHIACGGMDVAEIFETYRPLIKHVHFKDASADYVWKAMGDGVIDFPRIVRNLRDTNYNGWIMVEEESEKAVADPDGAMMENSSYVREQLIPII